MDISESSVWQTQINYASGALVCRMILLVWQAWHVHTLFLTSFFIPFQTQCKDTA